MKKLILSVTFASLLLSFSKVSAQSLSPQAQAVLNRLPAEQRAMALQEADRLRGRNNVSGNKTDSKISAEAIQDTKAEDEIETPGVEEDKLMIFAELEVSLMSDIEQEKENLLKAKEVLSESEFIEIEDNYNDRIHDMEKLLSEIKFAKINFLKERIDQLQEHEQDELKPFGYDFFNQSIKQIYNQSISSIPANYIVGSGDYLEVQLFGQENAGYSLVIGQNGMIQFPGIGPINAFEQGSSFENLKNLIKQKVRQNLGEGVQVSVSMGEVRMIKVFLAGGFNQPGIRLLPATSTVMEALLQSGGLSEYGSLRNVTLKRNGQTEKSFDIYKLLIDGENQAIESLLEGDVIFLPSVENRVIVKGEVARPAIYELANLSSLEEVVRIAGGLSSRAFSSHIQVSRMDEFGNLLIKSLSLSEDREFSLKNGDIIEVAAITDFAKTSIELSGEIDREGNFEWKKESKLSDIIKNRYMFTDNADLNYALIRRVDELGVMEILSFSPINVLSGSFDIPLVQKDKIIILSKFDHDKRKRAIRPLLKELSFYAKPSIGSEKISITGEVHFPGDYPKVSNMSVWDLIVAAGGLTESAYSLSAEISRINVDSNDSLIDASVNHILIDSLSKENALKQKLMPGDVLSVKKIPSWEESRDVILTGEVRFPGKYTISKNERIGNVIKRAGGLSSDAFSRGAVFTRMSLVAREEEQKENLIKQLESDLATLSLSPTSGETAKSANSVAQSLLTRLQNSKSVGRLVIDIEEQLGLSKNSQIVLRDGDKIHIPMIPSEVSILGEVQFPTSHLFNSSLSVDDYINLSGGITQNGDEKRIFVVKSNGAVVTKKGNGWFVGNKSNNIEVGDVIVVPINLQKGKWLESLTSSTQIIYQLAVTAAAVNSF